MCMREVRMPKCQRSASSNTRTRLLGTVGGSSQPIGTYSRHSELGSEEYINGGERWILCFADAPPEELRKMPAVVERIAAVKQQRLASKSRPTRELANAPTRFHVTVIPDRPFLCIPEVSCLLFD
jgi:hypothetical protein